MFFDKSESMMYHNQWSFEIMGSGVKWVLTSVAGLLYVGGTWLMAKIDE